MTDSMRDLEWYEPNPLHGKAQDKAIQARQCVIDDKQVADHWDELNEPVRKPPVLFRDVETDIVYQTSTPYEPGTLEVKKGKHLETKRTVKIEEIGGCNGLR